MLLVVLYHAQIVFPGGFVGVDVFFVISGYVIGRGLVSQLTETRTVSLRGFYMRRARRLLLALGAMLAIVLLLTPLLAPVAVIGVTIRTGVAAALFNANTYLYASGGAGYFAPAAELNPLLHTWSLSVEEQFYFVIPALMLAAWRLGTRRWSGLRSLRTLVAVLFTVSLVLCVWMSYASSIGPISGLRFAFFSPVTRTWEFAVGLGLVLLPAHWFPRAKAAAAMWTLGLAVIIGSALVLSDSTTFPGVAAALPVLGAGLVLAGTTHRVDPSASGTTMAPFTWLGDRSYSWYLWHWPLIVFAGAFWPNAGRWPLVAAAAVSIIPAMVSYRFTERGLPLKVPLRARPTFALAATCIAVPLVAAALAHVATPRLERLPATEQLSEARRLHFDHTEGCDDATPLLERDAPQRTACTLGDPDGSRTVLLVGDSNAGQLTEGLAAAADDDGVQLEVATMSGCRAATLAAETAADPRFNPRHDERCAQFLRGVTEAVAAEHPDLVVLAFSTNSRITAADGTPDAALRRATAEGMEQLAGDLQAQGVPVAIVRTPPKPGLDDEMPSTGRCSHLGSIVRPGLCASPTFPSDRADLADAHRLEDGVAEATGSATWDLTPSLCVDGRCAGQSGDRYVFRDGDHITVATSAQLAEVLAGYLERSLPTAGAEE